MQFSNRAIHNYLVVSFHNGWPTLCVFILDEKSKLNKPAAKYAVREFINRKKYRQMRDGNKITSKNKLRNYYYRLLLPYPRLSSLPLLRCRAPASTNIDFAQEQRQRLINYNYYYSFSNSVLEWLGRVRCSNCAHVHDTRWPSNLCDISENDL